MQLLLNKTVKPQNNLLKKYINSLEKEKNIKEQRSLPNNSENRIIRKASKYYSINIRNKIKQKMKEIEKRSRYKRNIFKLLYDQIHSDVAEIEKEVKIAKDLIVPFSLLRRNIIKNDILFNKILTQTDIKDLQKEENHIFKRNDSKLNIPKIKNYNFTNNSFHTNAITLNSSIRKDNNKSNTLLSFSKFKRQNNKNKTINLKTRNRQRMNLFGAITDNNYNIKDSLFNQDNDIIETELNAIINNNNEFSNTERINKNLFKKMNSKSMSKNNSKMTLIRVNSNLKSHKRKKILYVTYDEKWYLRKKFINIKLDKLEIENNYIQSQIISDQYALINENIKQITSKYLVDKELQNKFNSTNLTNQRIINLNFEESIGLMIEISYILLEKFEDKLECFISQIIKKPKKNEYKIVDDEKKEFNINITLFTETSSFLSASYKSYMILLDKDEYYKIDKFNFDKIYQYLDRLRLSMNKIILDMKTLYYGSNLREKKIIKDCVQKIIHIKEQKDILGKKQKLDCHRKFCAFRSGIDPFKYKGKLKIKLNEDKEIIMRINKALGKKNNIGKTFENVKKFDINSKLVNSLMKYGTKEFREFIIYERIRRKFYDKEKENDNSK